MDESFGIYKARLIGWNLMVYFVVGVIYLLAVISGIFNAFDISQIMIVIFYRFKLLVSRYYRIFL